MEQPARDDAPSGADARIEAEVQDRERRPAPRSPLLIGGIAYGLLFWMLLVIFALIAWRLSGG